MTLQVAGLIEESCVDGPGIRFVVFVQGCGHGCPGCQNPQTHSRSGGRELDTLHILNKMSENPLLDGLSLSGGEPFDQAEACGELARAAHERGYHVMVWTGYTFEQLREQRERPDWRRFLEAVDVLVDGPFVRELRSLVLLYRGSSNQRVLYLKK